MHKILGILGTIAAIIGFFFMASMFWAAANNGGMAVLGMQVFGVIAAIIAIIFGAMALFLARGQETSRGFANFALGTGLGTILALILAMIILG